MKVMLIILCLLLIKGLEYSFALNTIRVDSLEQIISSLPEKNKARKLIDMAGLCLYSLPQKSIYLSQKAYELATKRNNKIDKIEALRTIGVAFFIQDKYEEALKYYLKSLKISKQVKDENQVAVNLMNIGTLYSAWKKYPVALKYYEDGLEILKKNNENKGLTKVYNNIGMIYLICDKYNDALMSFTNSLKISTMLKDSLGIAHTLDNIGIVYSKKGNYTLALQTMEKALLISERSSDNQGTALTMNDIGEVYMKKKMYEKALFYFEKSLIILKKINDKNAMKICYENMLKVNFASNGNDKFHDYFKSFIAVSDSLSLEENSKQLAELQVKYETEKKDDEINILSKEQKIQTLEISKQKNFRNYLIISVFLVTILVFVIYSRFLIKKRSETTLQKMNQTKNKFFSIISHDLRGPINALFTITDQMTKRFEELSKEEILTSSQKLLKSTENISILLENLLQWSLSQTDRLDFKPAKYNLHDIVVKQISLRITTEKKINILCHISPDVFVFTDVNVLKTVLRNLLNNACKFSYPGGTVEIFAENKDRFYEVQIVDAGIGIKPEDIIKLFRLDVKHSTIGTANENGTGLGLILCKELLEKNGEKIWVESVIGNGSIFKFTLKKNDIC